MRIRGTSRVISAAALLVLVAVACTEMTPTVTPALPLPSLAPPTDTPIPVSSPSPAVVTPVQTATLLAPNQPTDSPVSSTPTPVIPRACPPPGDPDFPERPASFDDYPQVLAEFLSAGGSAVELERLLREWGAIADGAGEVRALDMTGDMDAETVVALIDPIPGVDLPWPPGDLLIYQCQTGAVEPVYRGRLAVREGSMDPEEAADLQFALERVEDVNNTGRADVVFVASSCGAHTCWDRLFVVEWDGTGFVNRVSDMAEYAYPTFTINESQILVDVGGIGSAGAGLQRSYQEIWVWDGKQFALAEQVVGPPTALVHYVHDGDAALTKGDYGGAIGHYEQVLEDASLPVGLFLENEEQAAAVLKAYARFKSNVAYAASGDYRGAQSQFDLLTAEHPQGTPGFPYVFLAQVFGSEFTANYDTAAACAAVTAIAEDDPTFVERLYAGYANPEYEAADLCRVGE
jgi:hypothetical protein